MSTEKQPKPPEHKTEKKQSLEPKSAAGSDEPKNEIANYGFTAKQLRDLDLYP